MEQGHKFKLCQAELLVFDSLPKCNLLKVVGGWVRDKLSGTTSHDMDFLIDSLGYELLEGFFKKELRAHGLKEGLLVELDCPNEVVFTRGAVKGSRMRKIRMRIKFSETCS